METYEQFTERCKQPIKIEEGRKALRQLVSGDYSLRVPVQIDDPDIILSRALDELEELRVRIKEMKVSQ